MFSKLHTKGPEQHPLYAALTGKESPAPGPVGWNFNKYLVGRDGRIISHFPSDSEPDSPALTKALETALAAKN
jgi:glutathione peroxidase